MATAKANKKLAAVAVDLPECPVCMETMSAPIFQCQSGHSLCNSCTKTLCPPICPICRENMTQMRNWQLEEIIAKAKVPCPNKSSGCVYTMVNSDLDDHLKECIFREMECPLGVVFGRCSWQGQLKEMMDHFKERHAANCNINSDTEVELNNVDVKEDDRHLYLISQGKMHFILTIKMDTLQKMAYWTIQHIGSKKVAKEHIYEIHITSNLDARRKVVFIEHCFNDSMKADEIFRLAKCAIIPLDSLKHFIKDKKLTFRFFVKRLPPPPKNNKNEGKNENKTSNDNKGPKGPGPKGPGPKGGGAKPNPNGLGPKAGKNKA